MNLNQREEMQREREEILATIAENKRADEEKTGKLREQNVAYRGDLLGQIDYNRRQRAQQTDEQVRLEQMQKESELEYQRKISYLLEKPVMQKVHPLRRGLYHSQSAGARVSYRDHAVINH